MTLNLVGRTIGRFDVLEELGRGGMAVVYKARQKSPNRIVALKVLPPELSFNKEYIARFHQEADSVAALEHPHIVPIYAVDESDGLHYIAMKFIQGRTLKEVAQEEGALSVERAVELVGQVADALDYAHSQQVIHRDIKPSNMMVTDNGWVYLTDFGLARGTTANAGLTATGTVMGTPEYMSPEQAQGVASIGPATDIYALGVVLYELLTGQFPFQADTPMAMLAARLIYPPRPPREYRGDLPFAVEDVLMRALARKPEARYATAGEMIAELRKAAGTGAQRQPQRPTTPSDGLTIPAAVPTPPPAPRQVAYLPPAPQPTPAPQQGAYLPPAPQRTATQGQQTPSWPQQPVAPPARKIGVGSGILIGIGATILIFILSCVGLLVWGSTLADTNATPTAQVSQRATTGTQPTEQVATPATPSIAADTSAITEQIAAGDTALEQADFNAAATAYQHALDAQPDSAEALARLALLSEFTANYSEVVAHSEKAIAATGSNTAQGAVAQALLSDGLVYTSKFDQAVEAATKAVELDSQLGLAHAAYANAVARLAAERWEPNSASAVPALIESTRLEAKDDPKMFQALTYSLIGDTYLSLHDLSGKESDLQSAKDAYSEALGLSEQPLFHTGLGFAHNRGGDYAAARGSFTKALELDSTFALAQIGLGWADFSDPEIKDFVPALANFDKALQIAPDDAAAFFARGRALFAQEKYGDATAAFRSAVTGQADSLYLAWLGRSLLREGFNSTAQGDKDRLYGESADVFLRALAINDRQVVAWTYLGWTRQYQEQYADSVDAFEKAIAINEQDSEAHNGMAWSLYSLEKFDQAEQSFRRAIELDKTYDNAFYGLGQTAEKLGKIDDAKQAYRDALQINPDYKDAQTALDKLPK